MASSYGVGGIHASCLLSCYLFAQCRSSTYRCTARSVRSSSTSTATYETSQHIKGEISSSQVVAITARYNIFYAAVQQSVPCRYALLNVTSPRLSTNMRITGSYNVLFILILGLPLRIYKLTYVLHNLNNGTSYLVTKTLDFLQRWRC